LIDEGCIPFPAAEGGYNSRLEVIRDLPKGTTLWMFDQTDVFKAKEVVGDTLCIMGNVSSSMLKVATPEEVKDYCKKLIDIVGKDGGFVLANGVFFDEAKPENVRAMVEAGKEYGFYN
jgi:uroporphyrinogen-III decarboxylase